MKRDFIRKRYELLEEVESLEKHKELQGKHRSTIHFEIVAHYGDCRNYERIDISRKHNERLFSEIEKIIQELNNEIELK